MVPPAYLFVEATRGEVARPAGVFQVAFELAVAERAHEKLLLAAGAFVALVLEVNKIAQRALGEDVVPAADVEDRDPHALPVEEEVGVPGALVDVGPPAA